MEKRHTKKELLDHYSKRTPHAFVQIDGFVCDGWDDVIKPDKNGHGVMAGSTFELMSGVADVRVLIVPGTKQADIIGLLDRISDWVKRGVMNDFPEEIRKEEETRKAKEIREESESGWKLEFKLEEPGHLLRIPCIFCDSEYRYGVCVSFYLNGRKTPYVMCNKCLQRSRVELLERLEHKAFHLLEDVDILNRLATHTREIPSYDDYKRAEQLHDERLMAEHEEFKKKHRPPLPDVDDFNDLPF
jgi:hypothetical protein